MMRGADHDSDESAGGKGCFARGLCKGQHQHGVNETIADMLRTTVIARPQSSTHRHRAAAVLNPPPSRGRSPHPNVIAYMDAPCFAS